MLKVWQETVNFNQFHNVELRQKSLFSLLFTLNGLMVSLEIDYHQSLFH